MTLLFDLPMRQKILLSLTILTGLFILLAHNASIISQENLNTTIFLYSFCVPMFLLSSDALIDLDKPNIFIIWATIGLLFLIAYFITKGNADFKVRRVPNFPSGGLNKFIGDSSTSPLKALPIFLFGHFVLNSLIKRKTGNYIINTARLRKWYNETAGRKIYWYDILVTILLLLTILFVGLFDF